MMGEHIKVPTSSHIHNHKLLPEVGIRHDNTHTPQREKGREGERKRGRERGREGEGGREGGREGER